MDKGLRQDLSTMASPLVSVVVPAYNMAQFLGETLQAVLNSTYAHIEVVVVDDGSEDDTFTLAQQFAQFDHRVRVYRQENSGVCRARNYAVSLSQGIYILPLDGDDLIAQHFIAQAVEILEQRPEVKVVNCEAEFFGHRKGHWNLTPFSLSLLARKNLLASCALYRRTDFDRIGGYCEAMVVREDWDFWISMLKSGGEVVRLPEVGFYYRVRPHSKRFQDRKKDKVVIALLNQRHPEFFYQHLGGPLRTMRSWSVCINKLLRCLGRLPALHSVQKQES